MESGDIMELQNIQIVAGSISSLFFISSNLPMLVKAYQTKNMHSYSLINLLLTNVGNLVYWLYVSSLPIGPIWFMHSFYTVTSVLMLVCYQRFERGLTPMRKRLFGHKIDCQQAT